jgi:hypothetical protein
MQQIFLKKGQRSKAADIQGHRGIFEHRKSASKLSIWWLRAKFK